MSRTSDRSVAVIRVLFFAALAISLAHYLDTWLRYDAYALNPDTPIQPWMMPFGWTMFTVIGLAGLVQVTRHRWWPATVLFAIYSLGGLLLSVMPAGLRLAGTLASASRPVLVGAAALWGVLIGGAFGLFTPNLSPRAAAWLGNAGWVGLITLGLMQWPLTPMSALWWLATVTAVSFVVAKVQLWLESQVSGIRRAT